MWKLKTVVVAVGGGAAFPLTVKSIGFETRARAAVNLAFFRCLSFLLLLVSFFSFLGFLVLSFLFKLCSFLGCFLFLLFSFSSCGWVSAAKQCKAIKSVF